MVQSNEKTPNYTQKFGLVNIMTDEEKTSYKAFNDRLMTMNYSDLMKLNMGTAGDVLSSEQRDLVAWQIKVRELEEMERRGIDPAKEFHMDNVKNVEYDTTTPNLINYQVNERNRIEGMSLESLENAKKIADNTPVVIHKDQMHNMNGGGVNIACNQYIVVDDNGNEVLVNNRSIQETFRKRYIKKMSEVTGFDFTKYNLDGSMDDPDLDYTTLNSNDESSKDVSMNNQSLVINDDEYEDD